MPDTSDLYRLRHELYDLLREPRSTEESLERIRYAMRHMEEYTWHTRSMRPSYSTHFLGVLMEVVTRAYSGKMGEAFGDRLRSILRNLR